LPTFRPFLQRWNLSLSLSENCSIETVIKTAAFDIASQVILPFFGSSFRLANWPTASSDMSSSLARKSLHA
jgi:hypothetical protein